MGCEIGYCRPCVLHPIGQSRCQYLDQVTLLCAKQHLHHLLQGETARRHAWRPRSRLLRHVSSRNDPNFRGHAYHAHVSLGRERRDRPPRDRVTDEIDRAGNYEELQTYVQTIYVGRDEADRRTVDARTDSGDRRRIFAAFLAQQVEKRCWLLAHMWDWGAEPLWVK
jgi:hypothetical protein